MKSLTLLFSLVLLGTTGLSAQNVAMPNGPGPYPPVARIVASNVATPVAPATPTGILQVLALQNSQTSGFTVLVTATDSAWVSCTVSASGPSVLQLATGTSWVPKGQSVVVALTTKLIPVPPPDNYVASCIPQFLTQPAEPTEITLNKSQLVPILSYALSPEPEAVTVLGTDEDWKGKFSVTEPGTLTLVLDDKVPGLDSTFDTTPGSPPTTRTMAAPIHSKDLEEGKYYRFHFAGTSEIGNSVLLQQNKTYLLYKSSKPQLATPISLTSQPDGIDVKFGLTREVTRLQLKFPSGVTLPPKSAPNSAGAASFTYEFVIPTDFQNAANSLDATTTQGIAKSLNDATQSGGTPTATGTVKLSIVDQEITGEPTIAELTLSVVRVSALPLISALKSQNVKLGLDKTTAQNVANQALGITASSSQQDKDTASALATLLTQKASSKNFKDSLVTFLITAGSAVAKAYGIPVPTPSVTQPSSSGTPPSPSGTPPT